MNPDIPQLLCVSVPDVPASTAIALIENCSRQLDGRLDAGQKKYLSTLKNSAGGGSNASNGVAAWTLARHLSRLTICEAAKSEIVTDQNGLPALTSGGSVSFAYGNNLAFILFAPASFGRIGMDAEAVFKNTCLEYQKNFFARLLPDYKQWARHPNGSRFYTCLWTMYECLFKLFQNHRLAQTVLKKGVCDLTRQKSAQRSKSFFVPRCLPWQGHWLAMLAQCKRITAVKCLQIHWQNLPGMFNADL